MTVSELIEKLKSVETLPNSDMSRDVFIRVGLDFTSDLSVWVGRDDDAIISENVYTTAASREMGV